MNRFVLIGLLCLCIGLQVQAKILRNNALMSKMISHFQQDNNLSVGSVGQQRDEAYKDSAKPLPSQEEENRKIPYEAPIQQREQEMPQSKLHKKANSVVHVMQHVLCRNFPTIPCNFIMQDEEINKLIKQSILQLSRKNDNTREVTTKPAITKAKSASTRPLPVDSEDLSNFLDVSHTGFFDETTQVKAQSKPTNIKNVWMHEKPTKKTFKKMSKDANRGSEMYSGKKMRKFYPHKIKYKDKGVAARGDNDNYREYRAVRRGLGGVGGVGGAGGAGGGGGDASPSAELPDIVPVAQAPQKAAPMSFKLEPSDSPVWRIDYMKRGAPSLNSVFGFQGKLMNSGRNQQALEGGGGGGGGAAAGGGQGRTERKAFYHTDVLHPDLYIKNNYSRKSQR